MLPRRLARSMTRNFLMRSLWGKKRKQSVNPQRYSMFLNGGGGNSLITIRTTQKWETHHYCRQTKLCLHDNLWSLTAEVFIGGQYFTKVPMKGKSCRWAQRIGSHVWKAADGLMNTAAKCCQVSNIPAFTTEGKASEMIHGRNILISVASQGGNDLEMIRLHLILLLILQ